MSSCAGIHTVGLAALWTSLKLIDFLCDQISLVDWPDKQTNSSWCSPSFWKQNNLFLIYKSLHKFYHCVCWSQLNMWNSISCFQYVWRWHLSWVSSRLCFHWPQSVYFLPLYFKIRYVWERFGLWSGHACTESASVTPTANISTVHIRI